MDQSLRLGLAACLEDGSNSPFGVRSRTLRGRNLDSGGGGEVEMDDPQFAEAFKSLRLVGRYAEEVQMLHLDYHAASSSLASGVLDFAILPRVTAAVCSSPRAILMTRIASLHCGILTFSKRFTLWDVC